MALSWKSLIWAAGLIAAFIGIMHAFSPNGIPWTTVAVAVIIAIAIFSGRIVTDWQMDGTLVVPETKSDKVVKIFLLVAAGVAIASTLISVFLMENAIRIHDLMTGASP